MTINIGRRRLSLRVLMRPSSAVLIVIVVAGIWALTLSPWGLLHSRTVFQGTLPTRVGSLSATLHLASRPTTLRASLVPRTSATSERPTADLVWSLVSPSGHEVDGHARLTSPDSSTGTYPVRMTGGAGPYRLVVGANSNVPSTVEVALLQSRDYVAGVSLAGVLFLGGLAYVTFTLVLAGGWAGRPVVLSPKHEHY